MVKAFSAGITLGTGFMHVLPDSFDMLSSDCLPETPWHKFHFTGFVAMLSAIFTLMVDSLTTSIYRKNCHARVSPAKAAEGGSPASTADSEMGVISAGHFDGHSHDHDHHHHHHEFKGEIINSQLLRYRVVAMRTTKSLHKLSRSAGEMSHIRQISTSNEIVKKNGLQVLELGVVIHSVLIGFSLGASNNVCTIKGLLAALCFHQMFGGMGSSSSLSNTIFLFLFFAVVGLWQAEFSWVKKMVMVFFFSVTTPLGIVIGMGLSRTYGDNSPTALITVGIPKAYSAGLLIYMALVDLLAFDFMGPKLQGSVKLQIKSYVTVFLGAGAMSHMAEWA
ncbi:hypothetical protein SAY87_008486 [Trapa incisa]|uniref:Zinc transporter 10 n=1 Tax=Trapa incisa TaxID=236973 RepID=A0AAN7KKQ1_9MYRT|nr:hypothetical protein SAY87_008486 [Trapa incisa]